MCLHCVSKKRPPFYFSYNSKKVILNSIIHTHFRLFTLSQKKTNCYFLTHHTWKMLPHYIVKCTNFSSFSIFTHIKYHQSAIQTSCGSVLLRHGLNFNRARWTMQFSLSKQTGSMYPCRSWSLWTLAVTLLAWHSICRTSQPVLFRATNANPQPAHSRATNVWRNAKYLQSDEKLCILQGSAVTFFRCGG